MNERILDIIREKLKSQLTEISLDTVLEDVFDSITFVNIVVELEETFDFEFEDEMLAVANFETLDDLIKYVESLVEM